MTNADAVRQVTVVFTRDKDGFYGASIRGLRRGGQAHGQTLEQVMQRIHEAVALSLATEPTGSALPSPGLARVGAQQLEFPA